MPVSVTATKGLLVPSKFIFVIDTPEFSNISFDCQTVNIPTVNVAPVEVGYQQFASKHPGDRITFDDFSATFLIDENMENYQVIYNWMLSQVTQNQDTEPVQKRDLSLLIYNNNNRLNKKIKMINAFPNSLSPIEFEATLSEDTPLVADIAFSIDYYQIVDAS